MNQPVLPDRLALSKFKEAQDAWIRRLEKAKQSARGFRDENGEWQCGLFAFVKYYWDVLEPETPLETDWPLEAMCQHLEAVTYGEIMQLLMNVPPGFMKSLLTDVFWPAWEWGPMNRAHLRYVTFSYASTLTERDNDRFGVLISSEKYQMLWGDRVHVVAKGQKKVSNTKMGWKFASSVGGVGTGERGDRIICVSGSTMAETELGKVSFSQLVDGKKARFVLGYDHVGKRPRWQRIVAYEANPARPLVRLRFDDETELVCTADHPIFIVGRGYTQAARVCEGDATLAIPSVRDVRSTVPAPLQDLQQGLQEQAGHAAGTGAWDAAVLGLRQADISHAGALGAVKGQAVLQPCLLRDGERGRGKSWMAWRLGRAVVQTVQNAVYGEASRGKTTGPLFAALRHVGPLEGGEVSAKARATNYVRRMRSAFGEAASQIQVLLQGLCGASARQTNARFGEWALCAWPAREAIRERLDAQAQGRSAEARWILLPSVPDDREGTRHGAARSPHQLRQRRYEFGQPDLAVPDVPRRNAWWDGISEGVDETTVVSVERIGSTEPVFNVRVEPDHNYFANGILTHNCDDPHNVKEAESDTVRKETVRWFRESMTSRHNNPKKPVVVIIMQRVHEEDVSGVILDLGLDYCHLKIPMEYDANYQFNDDGSLRSNALGWIDPRYDEDDPDEAEGTLAWPGRWGPDETAALKHTLGPYAYAGQYQQAPAPRGGGIFQRDWWQLWDSPDGRFPVFEYVLASLDSAFTDKEQNDPSGFTVWGVFVDETGRRRIMLVHAWRRHLKFSGPRIEYKPRESKDAYRRRTMSTWGLIEHVCDTCRRFKVDKLLIEAKASGISAAQELRNRYALEDWSIELRPVSGDKVARALGVQATFSQLMVYAPSRDWAQMVIDEAAVFPNGRYKDLTDSLTQAIKFLRDTGMAQTDDEATFVENQSVTHRPQPKAIYPV